MKRGVFLLALLASSATFAAETQARADEPKGETGEAPSPDPAILAAPPRKHGLITLTFAPYDVHLSRKTGGTYNAWPLLVGLEYEAPSRWGIAGAFFQNSFDQPTGYLGAQRRYTWGPEDNSFFIKVSAGLLYGYKRPHDLAVPLNVGGLSPAVIPIVGYKYWRMTAEVVIFGFFYGAMGAVGIDIWK
ncbi:MAG: hypothetical protein U0270_03175 [Labilithrix sp.]